MMDWIAGRWHRLPLILAFYFAAHIVFRTSISTSLDYDESEQVFLSQFLLLGYNSQPPLYTWIQSGMLEVLGYSVFPLALLKNIFLLLTYLLVFETVRKATDDLRLAAVATLGMFTIPQIAWESHRDLSHTVAATFCTTLLCYAVVSLAKATEQKRDRATAGMGWYVGIGVAVGLGAMFKYNFSVVVAGFVVSALTISRFRPLILDRRILLSVLIAACMIAPHAVWMIEHPDLVSSKTMTTLTTNQSDVWIENVLRGLSSLSLTVIACCAMTVGTFFVLYIRKPEPGAVRGAVDYGAYRLLVERFLLTVGAILLLIVLSGHAVEFKNRWIQPFICLVPAYLVLAFGPSVLARRRAMNLATCLALAMLVVILSAVISRPILGRYRGRYCWLNIPYGGVSQIIRSQGNFSPDIIVAAHTRVGGNLKMQYPDSLVMSPDAMYLTEQIAKRGRNRPMRVLVVSDHHNVKWVDELTEFAQKTLRSDVVAEGDCKAIEIQYVYGIAGETRQFLFKEVELRPAVESAGNVAKRPTEGFDRRAPSRR